MKANGAVDQDLMRRQNLSVVAHAIAEGGRTSRAAVASLTGLTRPAVSGLVVELESRGLVRDVGVVVREGSGRPPSLFEIDGRSFAALVVELNVGRVRVIARDLGLRELLSDTRSIDVSSPSAVRETLAPLLARALGALAEQGIRVVAGVLAAPALIDARQDRILAAPALGWGEVPLNEIVDVPGVPFLSESLANLAALGESRLPEYREFSHIVHVEAGTGVGAGTVLAGRVQRGGLGFAGAIGHMPLDPEGPLCRCGRTGCWEALAGVSALLRRALPHLGGTSLELPGDGDALVREAVARARQSDEVAVRGIAETGRWLGRGLSVLVNALSPELIVLGGYVPSVEEWIMPPLLAELDALVVLPERGGCEVRVSGLGSTAPEYGAAVMVQRQMLSASGLERLQGA